MSALISVLDDRAGRMSANASELLSRANYIVVYSDALTRMLENPEVRKDFIDKLYDASQLSTTNVSHDFRDAAKELNLNLQNKIYDLTKLHLKAGLVDFLKVPLMPMGMVTMLAARTLADGNTATVSSLAALGLIAGSVYRSFTTTLKFGNRVREDFFAQNPQEVFETGFKRMIDNLLSEILDEKDVRVGVLRSMESHARAGSSFEDALATTLKDPYNLRPTLSNEEEEKARAVALGDSLTVREMAPDAYQQAAMDTVKKCQVPSFKDLFRNHRGVMKADTYSV